MMYFPNIPVIPYEGPNSTNPLAFKCSITLTKSSLASP